MQQGDPMPEIHVSELEKLIKNIPDKPLSDAAVLVEPLNASIEQAVSPSVGEISFALGAGTSIEIYGFNAATDTDDDGVLASPGKKVGVEELNPQFTLGNRAWLKYKTNAHVKAGANVDLSFLATGVEGALTVGLLDYHSHGLTENIRQALRADATNLRAAVRAEDLNRLKLHDAMALQIRGNLKASVEVSWSDVFTTNLNQLTRFLQSNELLALKTSLGATLAANVTLTDDFFVVFSRASASAINVGIRKARSRGIGVSTGLGLKVEFKDADAVEEVLQQTLEGIAGISLAQVDELFNQLTSSGLDAEANQKLDMLLSRLQLDQFKNDPAGLKTEWQKIRNEVTETISEIAHSKITAGVSYEYLRLSTETNLLEVTLSETDARLMHPYFVKGDLSRVIDWMKSSGKEPVRYFSQRTLKTSSALGFSLGFNDWSLLSKSAKSLEVVEQKNWNNQRRIAYQGIRSYEGDLFGLDKTSFSTDLKADTAYFLDNPRAVDLYYGLHLVMSHTGENLSNKGMRHAVDAAIVWRVIDEAQEEHVMQQIRELQGSGQKVETRLELKLDDARFRDLLPLIAQARLDDFAQALARSMPWHTMKARSIVDIREQVYQPAWLAYLKNPTMSPEQAVNTVVYALRRNSNSNASDLRVNESRKVNGSIKTDGLWSFVELIYGQHATAAKWQSFTEGAQHLHRAFTNGWGHEAVRTAFKKMEELWRVSFQMKALGAYLTWLALQTPASMSGIERTFSIRILDKDQQLVISTSR
jgi:hypothetical protein